MRTLLFFLILGCCRVSWADLILTLEQVTPGDIQLGSDAQFNLLIRSTSDISNLAGIDFEIDAADPLGTTTSVRGGWFTSGASNFFPNVDASVAFRIPFPTSYAIFSANNSVGQTLGASDIVLATLTLSTLGASEGTYAMSLSNIGAVEPGFAPIPISNTSRTNLSYTVIGVPEPGNVLIVGIVFICLTKKRSCRSMRIANCVFLKK